MHSLRVSVFASFFISKTISRKNAEFMDFYSNNRNHTEQFRKIQNLSELDG